jgi:ubiquinol-cytochrome c reductase core subunit 2
MLSRTTACRGAQRAARQHIALSTQKRGLAAPASGSFQYQSGEAKGVKFASRDFAGPTTTLALVAKAGTRYQPLPGLTEGLANFAFRVGQPQLQSNMAPNALPLALPLPLRPSTASTELY